MLGTVTGARLLFVISMAVATMCAAVLAVTHDIHAVVVWTARSSLVLFALTYVARPATVLWPRPATKRLLRERKWLGDGFAISHVFHLAAIIGYAATEWAAFRAGRGPEVIVAIIAYVLIFAMAITSIDRVRAAMSKRGWDVLHLAGIHLAWIVFVGSYAKRLKQGPFYPAALGLLLAIAAIRAVAWLRTRSKARARASVAA